MSPSRVFVLLVLTLLIVTVASFVVYFYFSPDSQFWVYWIVGIAVAVLIVMAAIVQVTGYSLRDVLTRPRALGMADADALPGSALYKRNRQVMLQHVSEFWVKGVFENSLFSSALLSLGMEYRPELVIRPWQLVVQRAGEAGWVVPQGTKAIELFDQASGAFLILGAPG
ncbi:MAG: hypothetical protein ACT4QE_10645, partial [Anaerolineales bacterium]